MWFQKVIQRIKTKNNCSNSTPHDFMIQEKHRMNSIKESPASQLPAPSQVNNRVSSTVDPLTIDPPSTTHRSRSGTFRSRSLSGSPPTSFGDHDLTPVQPDLRARSRSSSSSMRSQEQRPGMVRRMSSLEIMKDLATRERDLESENLSQSLPEGFNVDYRNY